LDLFGRRSDAHPAPDRAAYIDNWLKVLKVDKKAIFAATSQATKATDFLGGLQSAEVEESA